MDVLSGRRDLSLSKGQSVLLIVNRWKLDIELALLGRAATGMAVYYLC